MLLLEAIARLSRSTLSGAVKGLLGVATLLVLAGPASGVVEQGLRPTGRRLHARRDRPSGRRVRGCHDRKPRSAGGASHDSARFQLDHARERDEVGGAWRRRLGTTTSRMLTPSPTSPPQRAVRLRGHALVWKQQLPANLEDTVEAASDPAAKLRELIDEHLSTVVPRYRDVVAVWDVVNEPLQRIHRRSRSQHLRAHPRRNLHRRGIPPGTRARSRRAARPERVLPLLRCRGRSSKRRPGDSSTSWSGCSTVESPSTGSASRPISTASYRP